eukprot:TRINITY_DN58406_c0_g1_i1.p1 TRINITY_DN58406_c0_g1~~TRINITY_DN58406_c0_g1_i1.p1  ORF type:complete len:715 (+),score=130.84 TRINITY_DN58406_c0_g1_i1:242-2146(+)
MHLSAETAFQMHLDSLLSLFVAAQQQNHEPLVAARCNEDSAAPLADLRTTVPQPFHQDFHERLKSERSERRKQTAWKSVFTGDPNRRRTNANHRSTTDDMISAQFYRLRDAQSNAVKADTLISIVVSFIGAHEELESLQDVLDFLYDSPDQPRADGATNQGMSHRDVELTFHLEEFRKLRSADTLKFSSHAVKRDVARLQQALESEELHCLYKDERRLEEFGLKPAVNPGPRGVVGFLLEYVPAVVIMVNAVVFGMSAEVLPGSVMWDVFEFVFTFVYMLEAATKVHFTGVRGYMCGHEKYWNWLDAACLATSVIDIAVTYSLQALNSGNQGEMSGFMLMRMLRLARLARLLKALRYAIFKELKLMVMGVISGLRVLAWAVVMLMVMLYVVGLMLNKLIGDQEEEFSTIMAAMSTLFRCFTDGCTAYNGTPLQERLRMTYDWPAFVLYFLLYILICGGVFNLIMALFIDNVAESQGDRKQQDLSDSAEHTEIAMKVALLRLLLQSKRNNVPVETEQEIRSLEGTALHKPNKVRAQFDCMVNADVSISSNVFSLWLEDPQFCETLENADICISNKAILFDTLDADMGGSLSVYEVFVGLMKLRGPVTKTDIVGMNLRIRHLVTLSSQYDEIIISE